MSEIISGKEALIALANGKEVQVWNGNIWWDVEGNYQINVFLKTQRKFRFKPRPILINGIEVPAPFEPNEDDKYFFIDPVNSNVGYSSDYYEDKNEHSCQTQFGAWRTEDEIKKVVSALRSIFKGDVK